MHFALVALLQTQATLPTPKRNVPDPGVIATGQRITPAGVQSVFDGRVTGVRFGRSASEIWVAAPGTTFRLDWKTNRVIARAITDGRPGIYGLAIDPLTHRAFVSSVGRIPRSRLVNVVPGVGRGAARRQPAVTQLSAFEGAATGDSVRMRLNSGSLGDYMA